MVYIKTPQEAIEWIKKNVRDPLPIDDKSRLHEYLDILSNDSSNTVYKEFALKGLSMIAIKYNASPIILCGALPLIRDQLLSPHPTVIAQSIRTLSILSDKGGLNDICKDKTDIFVRNLISKKDIPKYVKDMGLKFYFKMLKETPLDTSFG